MKKVTKLVSSTVASLALVVTTVAVNSVCLLFMYQPELPEGAESLYK